MDIQKEHKSQKFDSNLAISKQIWFQLTFAIFNEGPSWGPSSQKSCCLATYLDQSLSLVIKKLKFNPFSSLKDQRNGHFFQNTYPYLALIGWFSSNLALTCCKIWPKWAIWSFPQHLYWLKAIPRHLWITFFPIRTVGEPKGWQLQWPRESQSSELRALKSKSKYKSGFVIRNFQVFRLKPHDLR